MKKFIFTLLLILSFSVLADPRIEKAFERFYFEGPISDRHCGQNISSFIQTLAKSGLYQPSMQVISFKAPHHAWSFGNIVAVNSRWGTLKGSSYHQNWIFHVIAILDGKVYDFSFDRKPRVIPLKQYLREMFIPKEAFAINGMSFRVRGQGPYYTPAHAEDELDYYEFKTMSVDSKGNFKELKTGLSLAEFKAEVE